MPVAVWLFLFSVSLHASSFIDDYRGVYRVPKGAQKSWLRETDCRGHVIRDEPYEGAHARKTFVLHVSDETQTHWLFEGYAGEREGSQYLSFELINWKTPYGKSQVDRLPQTLWYRRWTTLNATAPETLLDEVKLVDLGDKKFHLEITKFDYWADLNCRKPPLRPSKLQFTFELERN